MSSREFLSTDRSWMPEAACKNTDPDLFFPIGTSEPALEQIENAKAICRQCNVQARCLEYALMNKIDHGIWGGADEADRRKLRRYTQSLGRTATEST